MLRNGKSIIGFTVYGSDDYIGPLRDVYFDDAEWVARYLVVELADQNLTNQYLISPLSVREILWDKQEILVNLTLSKVLNSPEMDTNLPISRQYEIALRRYYEWPIYWGQSSFLDTPPMPGYQRPTLPFFNSEEYPYDNDSSDEPPDMLGDINYENVPEEPEDPELMESEFARSEDEITYSSELRSFNELCGYKVISIDAESSYIADFIFDIDDWSIKYLDLNLGNNHTDQHILLTLHWLGQINWVKAELTINLTQQQLIEAPRYALNQPISKEFEINLFNYYDSI